MKPIIPHSAIRLALEPFPIAVLIITMSLFCLPSFLPSKIDPTLEWHLLNIKIRDQLITKQEALVKLRELETLLKDLYPRSGKEKSDGPLSFPLKSYGSRTIGGKEGGRYQIQGYDFFDGNRHKGHPGHDIFIRDKNQDGLDDGTGKPVEVISINLRWEPSSPIRGGNYVWIYDPIKSGYYYYAHLNEIFAKVGDIVSREDSLGTVGRTGVKAYPKRSPTHLHFVVHQSKEGHPKPINPYLELIKATND